MATTEANAPPPSRLPPKPAAATAAPHPAKAWHKWALIAVASLAVLAAVIKATPFLVVGTSMAQTVQVRREQFHEERIGEVIQPFNTLVNEYFAQAKQFFYQRTGDPVTSAQMAWQALDDLR